MPVLTDTLRVIDREQTERKPNDSLDQHFVVPFPCLPRIAALHCRNDSHMPRSFSNQNQYRSVPAVVRQLILQCVLLLWTCCA